MSREKEMFDRFAKEIASDIIKKEEDPDYNMILDRRSVVAKLSSLMGEGYAETASKFDNKINSYLKTLRRM
jgi:hypothetical protein